MDCDLRWALALEGGEVESQSSRDERELVNRDRYGTRQLQNSVREVDEDALRRDEVGGHRQTAAWELGEVGGRRTARAVDGGVVDLDHDGAAQVEVVDVDELHGSAGLESEVGLGLQDCRVVFGKEDGGDVDVGQLDARPVDQVLARVDRRAGAREQRALGDGELHHGHALRAVRSVRGDLNVRAGREDEGGAREDERAEAHRGRHLELHERVGVVDGNPGDAGRGIGVLARGRDRALPVEGGGARRLVDPGHERPHVDLHERRPHELGVTDGCAHRRPAPVVRGVVRREDGHGDLAGACDAESDSIDTEEQALAGRCVRVEAQGDHRQGRVLKRRGSAQLRVDLLGREVDGEDACDQAEQVLELDHAMRRDQAGREVDVGGRVVRVRHLGPVGPQRRRPVDRV